MRQDFFLIGKNISEFFSYEGYPRTVIKKLKATDTISIMNLDLQFYRDERNIMDRNKTEEKMNNCLSYLN